MKIVRIIPFLFLSCCASFAQSARDLVQFSGVIVTADSLRPIPFAHVIVGNTGRGTTSDYYGFFSLVVKKKETITFSALGYKHATFRIPDTLSENRYSLIQVMSGDTLMLTETVIYPWPSREQFRHTFLTMKVPDDDIEIAKRNIAYMEMREMYGRNYDPAKFGYTPQQSYRNQMMASADKLYYNGQMMPNNLLNPIAWAKFIKAWKNGDFKRKKM